MLRKVPLAALVSVADLWINPLIAQSEQAPGDLGTPDKVVVLKNKRLLILMKGTKA
jgi:hypothetical protein